MPNRVRALVLGGGGARGALQIGALRALLEYGYQPDLVVGTSIGAANAACLGLYGLCDEGLAAVEAAWRHTARANPLPPNFLWLTMRALVGRTSSQSEQRMRELLISHGVTPDLRFGDLTAIPTLAVAADLNSGKPVIYGNNPDESVLEAVLASAALPPWIRPVQSEGRSLIDGGIVSTLPIEPAIRAGATEIVALDLSDMRTLPQDASGVGPFIAKLMNTMQQRQADLELAVAEARGVQVRQIHLVPDPPSAIWDFAICEDLFAAGYRIAKAAIAEWPAEPVPERVPWWRGEWRGRNILSFPRGRRAA